MATITPNEGLDWYRNAILPANGADAEEIYDVAVGSGSASTSPSDTQLDQQLHRATKDDSIVDINPTSNIGEYEVSISISGGTEVPAGTSITEFGVWARDPSLPDSNFENGNESTNDGDDYMVYRENRTGITLESGDRKTFSFRITVRRL